MCACACVEPRGICQIVEPGANPHLPWSPPHSGLTHSSCLPKRQLPPSWGRGESAWAEQGSPSSLTPSPAPEPHPVPIGQPSSSPIVLLGCVDSPLSGILFTPSSRTHLNFARTVGQRLCPQPPTAIPPPSSPSPVHARRWPHPLPQVGRVDRPTAPTVVGRQLAARAGFPADLGFFSDGDV